MLYLKVTKKTNSLFCCIVDLAPGPSTAYCSSNVKTLTFQLNLESIAYPVHEIKSVSMPLMMTKCICRTVAVQLSYHNHFPQKIHFIRNEHVQTSNKIVLFVRHKQVCTSWACPIRSNTAFLLRRYRKRTDIYHSTWSFENVAKYCQLQLLDPPKKLPVSVFRPPPLQNIVATFRIVSFSF